MAKTRIYGRRIVTPDNLEVQNVETMHRINNSLLNGLILRMQQNTPQNENRIRGMV